MDTTPHQSGTIQADDRIQVTVDTDFALARVLGRGSYKVSGSMKRFAASIMDQGKSLLLIDLEQCVGMDSTFMGMLAGVSQRLQKEGGRKVVLTGVSKKLNHLMTTLGINRLVDIKDDIPVMSSSDMVDLDQPAESLLDSANTMLEAHETLVEIDDDNRLRFQDVLDYLREDIQRQQP
ncbi:MAG: STAS domain-containing protein [Kiritimatiellae bacterium]|jgi:anti-sigma B factor antagonist|nr:STAS domain-containing protein [Kiritimatiellia bacterium]